MRPGLRRSGMVWAAAPGAHENWRERPLPIAVFLPGSVRRKTRSALLNERRSRIEPRTRARALWDCSAWSRQGSQWRPWHDVQFPLTLACWAMRRACRTSTRWKSSSREAPNRKGRPVIFSPIESCRSFGVSSTVARAHRQYSRRLCWNLPASRKPIFTS